ncbi:hypothetical protein ACFQ0M_39945 [Kitasatospora aburaviensis]
MSTTQSATAASSSGRAAEATASAAAAAAGAVGSAADTARRIAELSPDQRARLEARLRERLARRPAATAGVPRRTPGAPVPLSFAQEQIWLAQQLAPSRRRTTCRWRSPAPGRWTPGGWPGRSAR